MKIEESWGELTSIPVFKRKKVSTVCNLTYHNMHEIFCGHILGQIFGMCSLWSLS